MTEAYAEKERAFMARRDALCEDVPVWAVSATTAFTPTAG